jgi:hypothetical protein
VGVKAAGAYDWQPYHLHVPTVLKSGSLDLLEPKRPVEACNGIIKIYRFLYDLHIRYFQFIRPEKCAVVLLMHYERKQWSRHTQGLQELLSLTPEWSFDASVWTYRYAPLSEVVTSKITNTLWPGTKRPG